MSLPQRKAIILDSDMLFVLSLEEHLTPHGFSTQALTTSGGAFAEIEFEKPDVLIIDTHMHGLNSEKLFHSIQQSPDLQELVIVLLSNESAKNMQHICLSSHINGYYSKKLKPENLGPFLLRFFP